jgi:hypothetical protein
MTDYFERIPDPVDALLTPTSGPINDVFRHDVLTRSTAVLRRRRRLRRLTRLTALAACYVAGLMTLHDVRPVATPGTAPVIQAAIPDEIPNSAVALEWEALDHPDQSAPLYRAAADRYLTEDADLQGAVRCYGNSLTRGNTEELTIEPTDSWLLIAIKDARQKEMHDAD